MTIFSLGVTGGPSLIWDESEDRFVFNKALDARYISFADTTLSGTPKVLLLRDDAGTAYYVKVYPVKA